jgi:hypothetical protein
MKLVDFVTGKESFCRGDSIVGVHRTRVKDAKDDRAVEIWHSLGFARDSLQLREDIRCQWGHVGFGMGEVR